MLDKNGIFEVFQSGFKTLHSTELALLRVSNDILLATDSGKVVILVLLDLTTAFDTVDHSILISCLEHWDATGFNPRAASVCSLFAPLGFCLTEAWHLVPLLCGRLSNLCTPGME